MNYRTEEAINHFIREALTEDVGTIGDVTTMASIPKDTLGIANLKIKDDGILAGVVLSEKIFRYLDPAIKITLLKKDGDAVKTGESAFAVEGKVHTILKAERLVLNCMQRMSGIATYTAKLNKRIAHTNAKLLDTRKTTPNFRIPEKWAVEIGGGVNHRFALYDMILLKDNHIDFAGGIQKAVNAANEYVQQTGKVLKIEVETRNITEVEEALKTKGLARIMLDNMSPVEMKKAIGLINGKYETEASGGITEKNIAEIAETGVDYISVGALTHSIKSLDLSLKAEILR